MQVLKENTLIENRWRFINDSDVVPVEIPIIVSYSRLVGDDSDYLFHCGCCLGVFVKPGDDIQPLRKWINRLDLIALEFPKFSDGRAYSSARLLREQMDFAGELRAIGDVLIDQYAFMRQCGFDAVELPMSGDVDTWLAALKEMSVHYQADTRMPGQLSALQVRRLQTSRMRAA